MCSVCRFNASKRILEYAIRNQVICVSAKQSLVNDLEVGTVNIQCFAVDH